MAANVSSTNLTMDLLSLDSSVFSTIESGDMYAHMEASSIPKHTLLAIFAVIIVIGNGALIWIILRHKQLRTVTNLFVVALAFADFTMGFPSIPFHILAERQAMGKTSWVCLVSMALTSAQIVVSVIMLFALSLERYLNLVHPFTHRSFLTRRRAVIVIALCWTYAVMFGLIPVFGWNALPDTVTTKNQTFIAVCRFELVLTGGYIALLFLGHILPASLILPMLHIRVFLTARQVLRRHADMNDHMIPRKTSSDSMQSNTTPPEQSLLSRTKRNLRPFKILVVMVLYFIISWVPLTVWEVIVFKGFTIQNPDPTTLFRSSLEKNAYYVAVGLAVMNSVVNPLFYGIGSRNIRQSLVMKTKQLCGCVDDGEEVRYSYASVSAGNAGGVSMKTVSKLRRQRKSVPSSLQDCKL